MSRTSAHPSCVRACTCLSICYLISTVRVGWEFTRKRNISKGLIRFATVASSRSTRVCRRKTTSKNSRFFDFSFSFSFTLLSSLFSFSPASILLFWLINPFKSRGFMSSRGHADPLSLSLSSVCLCPRFPPTRKLAFARWPTVSDGFQDKKKKKNVSRSRSVSSSRLDHPYIRANNTGHSRIRRSSGGDLRRGVFFSPNLTNESFMNY